MSRPKKLLALARRFRREQTYAERVLWSLLRNRKFFGLKFRCQHPVKRYILDFYCHEAKLAIELDGGPHGHPGKQLHDKQRSAFLKKQGITVIRFWNHEVLQHTESVLRSISKTLTPALSQREREIFGSSPAIGNPAPFKFRPFPMTHSQRDRKLELDDSLSITRKAAIFKKDVVAIQSVTDAKKSNIPKAALRSSLVGKRRTVPGESHPRKLLVIDNYDSFTYNLVQLFRRFKLTVEVFRCDQITPAQADHAGPDYLLVGPGPRDPAHAGQSLALIDTFYRRIPVLGVCLGMQCINELFGGQTVRAKVPVHGKTSLVYHDQSDLFHGLPSPFTAARYHSLVTEPAPQTLEQLSISAKTGDDVIMGMAHNHFPLRGVQFHPESFLTQFGHKLAANFLQMRAPAHDTP